MHLAATHLQPAISIIVAAGVAVWIVWYWVRLGAVDIPESRRHLRRISLALMALSLPVFVLALSYLDPALHPRPYAFAWTFAMLLVMLVIITAVMDAMNNVRLLREQQHEALHETAAALVKDVKEHKKTLASVEPWVTNGHADKHDEGSQ